MKPRAADPPFDRINMHRRARRPAQVPAARPGGSGVANAPPTCRPAYCRATGPVPTRNRPPARERQLAGARRPTAAAASTAGLVSRPPRPSSDRGGHPHLAAGSHRVARTLTARLLQARSNAEPAALQLRPFFRADSFPEPSGLHSLTERHQGARSSLVPAAHRPPCHSALQTAFTADSIQQRLPQGRSAQKPPSACSHLVAAASAE